GAKAADKAFNFVAKDQVGKLAEKFDAGKAKAALEWGKDKLKDKAIKFAASSDQPKAVQSFLDALLKSANDSIHTLPHYIQTTQDLSEAIGYYNLFSMPLQSTYVATLTQQVDDMLSELNDAMAQHGEPKMTSPDGNSTSTSLDEIARLPYQG